MFPTAGLHDARRRGEGRGRRHRASKGSSFQGVREVSAMETRLLFWCMVVAMPVLRRRVLVVYD